MCVWWVKDRQSEKVLLPPSNMCRDAQTQGVALDNECRYCILMEYGGVKADTFIVRHIFYSGGRLAVRGACWVNFFLLSRAIGL